MTISYEDKYVKHETVLQWLRDSLSSTAETEYRKKALESYQFYSNVQDTTENIVKLGDLKRPTSVFNEVKPKIDMLVGMAAQAPTTSTAVPVGGEDEALTEVMNAVLFHYTKKLEINRKRNKCFEHTCKSGRSLHWFWIDGDSNPFKPTPKSKRWRGDQFYCDPNAVTMDLTVDGDHRYLFLEQWVTEEVLKRMVPKGYDVEMLKVSPREPDGLTFWNEAQDLYRLMEGWYFIDEKVYWFVNPISGTEEGLTEEQYSDWKKACLEGIPLDPQAREVFQLTTQQFREWESSAVMERYRKWPYYRIFSDTIVIVNERSPMKWPGIPGILYGAYKDDDNNTWLSVIEAAKEPQRALNTIMRQLVYLLQTLPKGILVHEVGAILDIERYESNSAEPNYHLEVAAGALDKIKWEKQGTISPVYQQLISTFIMFIKSATGIHDDLMGIETSSREPTSTLRARQQTSFAVLYILFDNFRVSRFRETKLLLSLIQQYVTAPEWVRITGPQGAQMMQINTQLNPENAGFNDISAVEYDMEVDEINETTTIRMMIASILSEFNSQNPNSIPPDVMLEYMNMPFSVKQRIRDHWMQQQQIEQEERNRAYELELLKLGVTAEAKQEKTSEKTPKKEK